MEAHDRKGDADERADEDARKKRTCGSQFRLRPPNSAVS
jgi:hypothetical protein